MGDPASVKKVLPGPPESHKPSRSPISPSTHTSDELGLAGMSAAGSDPQRQSSSSTDEDAPLSFSSDESISPPAPLVSLDSQLNHSPSSITLSLQPSRPPMRRAGTDPSRPPNRAPASLESNSPPVAGPSTYRPRPTRYANPDTHWLSEDEGEMFTSDVNRDRRQPFSHQPDDESGPDSKDIDPNSKDTNSKSPVPQSGQTESVSICDVQLGHPIHHKPAAFPTDTSSPGKDFTFLIPDLSTITPNLLTSLECPTCHKVMQDPVTLLCGHAACLFCSAPDPLPGARRRKVIGNRLPIEPSSAPAYAHPNSSITPLSRSLTESGEDGQDGINDEDRTSSSLSSSLLEQGNVSKKPTLAQADTFCPLPTCRTLTKARVHGRSGLQTDFVLQKLTSLLRVHTFSSPGEDEDQPPETSESRSDSEVFDRSVPVHASGSSPGSSPDEAPKSGDISKRAMHSRKRQVGSSKRARGSHRVSASSSPSRSTSPALPSLVVDVLSELECQVCVTLIYEPLTTPCGHTFCKRCLFRSLDHSSRCPLCRSDLPGFNFFIAAPLNFTIHNLLLTTFPRLYAERKDVIDREDGESGLDTPIFVCMVAFPTMPTNLHIYEPRYRLMMRRAMDLNKRFGMVLPSRSNGGFSQYGTMLEITNAQMFDDGRSLVETVGVHRFKILESGTLDGYNVGRIERIEDIDDEEEAELEALAIARGAARLHAASQSQTTSAAQNTDADATPGAATALALESAPSQSGAEDPESAIDTSEFTNEQLMGLCKAFVEALRDGSTPWLLQRLSNSVPPMPEDPKEFTWWMAMLMPIDDHEKARLLQVDRDFVRAQ